jgi:membrane protease YdiL (CAAX protease family)
MNLGMLKRGNERVGTVLRISSDRTRERAMADYIVVFGIIIMIISVLVSAARTEGLPEVQALGVGASSTFPPDFQGCIFAAPAAELILWRGGF